MLCNVREIAVTKPCKLFDYESIRKQYADAEQVALDRHDHLRSVRSFLVDGGLSGVHEGVSREDFVPSTPHWRMLTAKLQNA